MFKLLVIAGMIAGGVTFAADEEALYLTIGSDAVSSANKSLVSATQIEAGEEISIIKAKKEDIPALSALMHEEFNRCGGFIVHDSLEEAREVLHNSGVRQFAKAMRFADYAINQQEMVNSFVAQTSEPLIRSMIEKLSSYHNRFYKADTGVESQAWIKSQWEALGKGRNDVAVDYFEHSKWPQPSVIMTLEGSSLKDEVVVIGGHADSIAGWWGQANSRAPGADDNASGIATITETIRIAMANGFKPERTIKFMAYAAEEVGLLGSKEIAKSFKRDGKKVVGVLQLDMTNFKGTPDYDIVFMTDYTNQEQNEFLARLVDEYVQVPWGWSRCGYGCSDHAAWHNEGFPASIPFESTMSDSNRKIHTKGDLIEVSGGHASHAEKFAKLAVAYMVEMGL